MKTYLLKNIEDVYQQITLDSVQLRESLNLGDGGLEDCANLGLLDIKFSDRWKKVDTSFAPLPDHPDAGALSLLLDANCMAWPRETVN